ncbi:MAG: hypothetical protein SF069_15385 [Phycisphaerae bacterium]|nr:hypothetical protein [Phycisphaerae bacterium]
MIGFTPSFRTHSKSLLVPALFALLAWAAQPAAAQPQQLVTNGGFEDAFDFNSWTIDPAFSGSLLNCVSNPAIARSGNRSAHFGAHEGLPDVLRKQIATQPGLTYQVSFWLSSDNIAPVFDGFQVFWEDQLLLDLNAPQQGFAYTRYSYNVVAGDSASQISFLGFKRFGTFRLDDVEITLAPASNQCASAPTILANQVYFGDTFGATNDINASCGLVLGADVWYRFIAPCNNTLTLDLCGSSFDTTLSVWTGSCGALSQVACNDDNTGQGNCGGADTSFLSVPVTAGTIYYIRIAGFSALNRGNYRLDVRMPLPANDACADALPVTLGSVINGSNTCATADGQYSCANIFSRDLWYSYTPTCDHVLRLDTCSTTWDTVLAIYTGSCGALTQMQCNDDTPGCGNNRGSVIEIPVVAGTRYLISVAQFGAGAAAGNFVLNVNSVEPLRDTCATAQPIVNGPHSFNAECASAPSARYCNAPPLNRPGYWFSYTASCTGQVIVDICDAEGVSGAWLSAFSGSCTSLSCVGAQQLSALSVCPQSTEAFSFDATQGATYYICYAPPPGDSPRSGTITITPVRPENDFCLDATLVANGTYFENTRCATVDGAASCGISSGTPDVWYRWDAVCDGRLSLDTCGSELDTVLSVYGGSCQERVELACNDDASFCPEFIRASRLELLVAGGESLWIRVSGFNGGVGAFQLNVLFAASDNGSCTLAEPLAAGSVEFDGECAIGTGGRFCNAPTGTPGEWFAYTATCGGPKAVEFCRTAGPAELLLSVYEGDCSGLTCIGSRHMTNVTQFCPSGVEVLTFNAVAGATYRFCYTQFAGIPMGAGELTVRDLPPLNDICAAAAPLVLGQTSADAGCATADGPAQCFPDARGVWYSYTPPVSGRLTLDTCGSSADTVLSVLDGGCAGLVVACNDDADASSDCFGTLASKVDVIVEAGVQYRVYVGVKGGGVASFVLNANFAAANDACSEAQLLPLSGTSSGDLTLASNDATASCGGSADRDLWYRWLPTNCSTRLTVDTCGSVADTTLSIFTGTSCANLVEVACNDDATAPGTCAGPGDSYLSILVSGGEQYWIRVAGSGGALGSFNLNVVDAARNDSCATALLAAGGTTEFDGSCGGIDATPASCGRPNQATLWFIYTASCTGTVDVDTCGSNYNTSLAVYGGACGQLSEIACNDNSPLCTENPFNSRVEFPATAGVTYRIRLSSIDSELGDGVLNIQCSPSASSIGDMNCDGFVTVGDIGGFVIALTNPAQYAIQFPGCNIMNGDVNIDGFVTVGDIGAFVALLTGG